MPSTKSAPASGKKHLPMPAPQSVTYRKIVAAKKRAAAKPAAGKSGKKRGAHGQTYSTIESRHRALERAKRTIWKHFDEINAGIIRVAEAGNCSAAKALFDMAGVFNLPPLDDQPQTATGAMEAPAEASSESDAMNPVDAFFRSIGIEPACKEPEPGSAA
jgi:hypothetical protein